jgi:hypothetical protein
MLKGYASDNSMIVKASLNIQKEALTGIKTIFLSHSHQDEVLVKGFITYLGILGIKIYVDWQDSDMPKATNRETAEKIKKQIVRNDFFLVLATKNALNSRWVPWEIGVADQIKTNHDKIGIIPVVDETGVFKGNEYLQLYKRITLDEVFKNRIQLYEASSHQARDVKDWLNS